MTQSVNCDFFGLDRFGLVSPPDPGLESIRNQTLPRAITDWRVSPQGGSALIAYFGGFQGLARRAALSISRDNQSVSPESRELTLVVGVSIRLLNAASCSASISTSVSVDAGNARERHEQFPTESGERRGQTLAAALTVNHLSMPAVEGSKPVPATRTRGASSSQ